MWLQFDFNKNYVSVLCHFEYTANYSSKVACCNQDNTTFDMDVTAYDLENSLTFDNKA